MNIIKKTPALNCKVDLKVQLKVSLLYCLFNNENNIVFNISHYSNEGGIYLI